MATTVEVNGVSKRFQLNSLSFEEGVKSAGTASCVFLDDNSGASAYVPTHGQTFEVKIGGNIKFGGEITSVSERYAIEGYGTAVQVNVQSYSTYLDAAVVDFEIADGAYTEKSLVTYLVSNYLGADYGITADSGMTNGITLPALQFRNVTARAVLDTISRLGGRVYRLTAAKLLKLYSVGTDGAVFSVGEAEVLRGTTVTDVEPGGNYYNSVVVKGTFASTENITGNGALSAWGLSYDPVLDASGWIVSRGLVTEAGADYPLGLYGVDTTLWTFDPATSILHRSSALGNGVVVTFDYTVGAVGYDDATGEIAAHKRRGRTFTTESAVTADAAYDYAVALVRIGIAGDAKKVTLRTRQTSMAYPTQTITLNIPSRNVASASYLIENVKVAFGEDDAQNNVQLLELTCREGSEVGGEWQDLFKNLGGGSGGVSSDIVLGGTIPTGGGLSGVGTTGYLPIWLGTDTLGNSPVSATGSAVTVTGTLNVTSTLAWGGGAAISSSANVGLLNAANDWTGVGNLFMHGGAAWPTSIIGRTAGRVGVSSTLAGNSLFLSHSDAAIGAEVGPGGIFFSGRSNNTGPVHALFGLVTAWKENATSGNQLGALVFYTNTGGGLAQSIKFSSTVGTITTPASTNLSLAPTGDVVLGPAGFDVLPNANYAINLGMLTNKYLTLHAAELWVETLVAQETIATIGGRVLVAPTNMLATDLASGATSGVWKYNNFANGDRIYMEANGQVEFMAVTSSASGSAGAYTYSLTRNLDGSGANNWVAGDAALNTGTTGNGFIDIYSVRGVKSGSEAGPTIVGNVRLSTTYNDWAPRWAIGNLNGLYGYGATTYGACFGDPSATNVTVDATNGFRIRSSTTNKFYADTSGNLFLAGSLVVTGSGTFSGGNVSLSTNGITVGAPGASISTNYAYNFVTAFSGTNSNGLFAIEAGGTTRITYLYSQTDQASKTIGIELDADSNGVVATFGVQSSGATAFAYTNCRLGVQKTPQASCALDIAGGGTGSGSNTILAYDASANVNLQIRDDGYGYLRAAAWAYGSDAKLKRNVRYFKGAEADSLAVVAALLPARFDYIDGLENQLGFVAQDVQKVLPEAVEASHDGTLGLKTGFIIPHLVAAIHALQAELAALRGEGVGQ